MRNKKQMSPAVKRTVSQAVVLAGVLILAAACLGGCKEKGEYAEAEADVADTFPLEAQDAGENPQLISSDGPYALVHTTAGDITILLYEEEAPKAVENFIRLAEEGYYDGSPFSYVKKDELAQTGAPSDSGEERSSFGEPFEDEFSDSLHNFPGAVGMAGDGIDQNLSQFYMTVSREKPEDERVVSASMYINELLRQTQETLDQSQGETKMTEEEVQALEDELNARIQAINTEGIPTEYLERYQPAVSRYLEYGGKWGLDYKQTVFGQIVKGLNVAEAITKVKVNAEDRSPQQDIFIESIEILDTLEEQDS